MPKMEIDSKLARRQLEQILASSGFSKNLRMGRFLRFVVERHIDGRDDEIKESVIAVEVFGRSPDHDPKRDPIVRTEATRLRARLGEYYANGGASDPLVIELPKGGYVPAFVATDHSKPTTRRFWNRWAIAAGLAAVLVMAAPLDSGRLFSSASIAIAVLPLQNLSDDPSGDYFADGLTDELIHDLAVIDGLTPRSRTSSFAFKGKPRNVREVGRQLDVSYIVEGSVLRAGPQLRINIQLVRARDDVPVWSGKYDQQVTDVFAIQEEISRNIVNAVRLKLGHGLRQHLLTTWSPSRPSGSHRTTLVNVGNDASRTGLPIALPRTPRLTAKSYPRSTP